MDLKGELETILHLTPRQKSALRKLGIQTVRDLLFHFPARYEDIGGLKQIRECVEGEKASVIAEVVGIKPEKTWKKRLRIAEGIVRDHTGLLQVVWFNQPYIANILKPKTQARFSGKVTRNKTGLVMTNPSFDPVENYSQLTYQNSLLPVYPETYGITSRWFRYQIQRLLPTLSSLTDAIPQDILTKYHLPNVDRAIRAIHSPKSLGEAEAARKRFAFEEIFIIQLERQRERKKLEGEKAFVIAPSLELISRFRESLPFSLTGAQERAIQQILQDFEKARPMARLLEGDVGSGKTIVAAASALNVIAAGYQVAYMAPTEILARQHFEEFIKRLAPFKIRIGLLTGSEARKFPSKINPKNATHISKSQLLKWCTNGEMQIVIGTHALIEDRVKFKKLAFAIVDEQHRFGVAQRKGVTKGIRPHFLSMSATPIPRTLALTIYGDLDLTLLDEMPPGRMPVETRIVHPRDREKTYEFIREEVKRGGQVFVICPKIEDKKKEDLSLLSAPYSLSPSSQAKLEWSEVKSVKAEFKRLSEDIFPELRIGMVHGKLKPKEKEDVMRKFSAKGGSLPAGRQAPGGKNHEIDILVSTSVVEVGVDVPNASIMMIEGGERFGLAQLHQFRGRVGRGTRQSYCFVFTTSQDHAGNRRLKALQDVKTGFELAEYDLQFRGPGELSGKKQWGISDVGMEALKNIKMVEAARFEAQAIIAEDFELAQYPLLRARVDEFGTESHFE